MHSSLSKYHSKSQLEDPETPPSRLWLHWNKGWRKIWPRTWFLWSCWCKDDLRWLKVLHDPEDAWLWWTQVSKFETAKARLSSSSCCNHKPTGGYQFHLTFPPKHEDHQWPNLDLPLKCRWSCQKTWVLSLVYFANFCSSLGYQTVWCCVNGLSLRWSLPASHES